jgi:ATP-dependent DNA helicase DinG
MAESVADAVADQRALLVEAGTGTGKSLAYLTPAILAEKRTIVATATIALQDQLVSNDIPRIAEGLGLDVSAAVLKGRRNYLCNQRLAEFDRSNHEEQLQLLRGRAAGDHLQEIRDWAAETESGDREELDPAPPPDVWAAVSVGADECPGAARCPSGDGCFSERARTIAREADVIVTNHHYYGIDLASGGALLPEHDVVVFDEAHHLPDVIGATCGTELSGGRVRTLARRTRGVLTDEDLPLLLDRSAIDLDRQLGPGIGSKLDVDPDIVAMLVAARDRADKVLAALRKVKAPEGSDAEAKTERALLSANNLVNDIDAVLGADDTNDVLWVDGSESNPVLRRTPLDVGGILEHQLWDDRAVVLTSATLPDAMVEQLGLPPTTTVERVGSPFPYPELGLLYCSPDLPNPNSPEARAAVQEEMRVLIEAAGGRTLGLFTSSSAMREAAETLRETLDLPILLQGENSKAALVAEFQRDPRTVLLATMSFWQGIDLPGDTLTLVTIDRLPFPRPDEPVTQARRDRARAAAFRTVDLPRVQILLAQAAGRLVRRTDDRGVVAVLDPRLATKKSYRWDVINALPPFRRTRHRDEVVTFLRSLDNDGT